MERFRYQIVAEHHGDIVSMQCVDRGASSTNLRLVEYVVVHKCRHVDHLDNGCQNPVTVVEAVHGVGTRGREG